MDYELINVEKKDHLTIITLNRPEVLNAINPPICLELDHAFDAFQDDPDAWVAILTGAGDRAFSAGNDLKYEALTPLAEKKEIRSRVKYGFGGIVFNYRLDKPVIAAINGLTMGGGFEMALACDIIIAVDKATFSFPEPMVGRVPAGGGVHRISRQIPYHLAMDLLLTRKRITADEALQYGIVSQVVPGNELMAAAEKKADEIMKGSPFAIRTIKHMVRFGQDMPLQEANATIFPIQKEFMQSKDFIEGPLAFAQKRKPEWKGC